MKTWIAAAALVMIAPLANATSVTFTGAEVAAFITEYFPDASLPGEVKGAFTYTNSAGQSAQGYADCTVPSMGQQSDGIVATCTVTY